MPIIFIHFTLLFFTVTALTGVWMRATPFLQFFSFSYEHVLHAHSHLAILGWTFLGVIIILLTIIWRQLTRKRHLYVLLTILIIVTSCMFLAFLYEGYGTYSIIFSTLHIFVEYWVIFFFISVLKQNGAIPKIAKAFIYGSFIALFLSSFGPFALGFLGMAGLKDSIYFEMAIYYYLHFQYNGWLFLFLIGTFIILLTKKAIIINERIFKFVFITYFIALFPSYIASVLWAGVIPFGEVFALIGNIGQFVAMTVLVVYILKESLLLKEHFNPSTIRFIQLLFIILIMKSVMELGLSVPHLAQLVFDTRSVIIGYLHFMLLGFVSIFILLQFTMVGIVSFKNRAMKFGIVFFLTGFILNEALLFFNGLQSWLKIPPLSLNQELLLLASLSLLLGIVCIWFSVKRMKRQSQFQNIIEVGKI